MTEAQQNNIAGRKRGLFEAVPWLFSTPALAFLLCFVVVPTFQSLFFSLTDADLESLTSGEYSFVGIANYLRLFADESFRNASWLLFKFSALTTLIEVVFALFVALALEFWLKPPPLVRSLLLIPMFVVPLVSGLTFRFLLDPSDGVMGEVAAIFGQEAPDLLGDGTLAFWLVVLQDFWRMWPFVFMIVYSGLKTLPHEPLEAFQIDGGTRLQSLRYVVLPLLWPSLAVAVGLKVIESLKAFTEIYVMTGGGPGESTNILSMYIVKQAFEFFDLSGAAAAGSVLLFVGLVALGCFLWVQSWASRGAQA